MAGNIPALSWVVLEVAAGVEPASDGFADRRLAVQPRDQNLASTSQGRGAKLEQAAGIEPASRAWKARAQATMPRLRTTPNC